MLPEDLRICLEVLDTVVLKGHLTLCDGLKKRYEEQYPLVRSLADVFVANAHILSGYATYVLHLERALEQVDNALSTAETKRPKNRDAAEWQKICRLLRGLESAAADRGETGLAISLSKPFQRLLKYPLLFQNLLFHTDPSTFEYESTLQMVAEVETIVRSIEDEKIQKEERDKTRDVFARIDGLEKIKMLAIPKPSRLLLEEKRYEPLSLPETRGDRGTAHLSAAGTMGSSSGLDPSKVKQKSSFKRISDAFPGRDKNGVGGKNDLWLVVFNDVVLRCQRVGTTSLPLTHTPGPSASRAASLPEFSSKSKSATRRTSQAKPRNLYKFVKVETWTINNAPNKTPGVVSMEDIGRARSSNVVAIEPVKSGDTDDEDGNDSDESDTKSKMSFSYWGADKITLVPGTTLAPKGRSTPAGSSTPTKRVTNGSTSTNRTPVRRSNPASPPYGRTESTANAKFGHRLRNQEDGHDRSPSATGGSRKASGSSSHVQSRRGTTDDGVMSVRSGLGSKHTSVTRVKGPLPGSGSTTSSPRTARTHYTSNASSTIPPSRLKVGGSPVPSHDSGVGMGRAD